MSGPDADGLPMPDPDPEWIARFDAKSADLVAERERRMRIAAVLEAASQPPPTAEDEL